MHLVYVGTHTNLHYEYIRVPTILSEKAIWAVTHIMLLPDTGFVCRPLRLACFTCQADFGDNVINVCMCCWELHVLPGTAGRVWLLSLQTTQLA